MRVGAEDHLAAARLHLAHVLVDDGDVRGHEDSAVLLRGGKPEDVVVLVDGAADGAQGVVAVGEHVGDGELGHARRLGRLYDATYVMSWLARASNRSLRWAMSPLVLCSARMPYAIVPRAPRLVGELERRFDGLERTFLGDDRLAVHQVHAAGMQGDRFCHESLSVLDIRAPPGHIRR